MVAVARFLLSRGEARAATWGSDLDPANERPDRTQYDVGGHGKCVAVALVAWRALSIEADDMDDCSIVCSVCVLGGMYVFV